MSYTTVDLLTESGQNILTEDGSSFLIISKHLVVEVRDSGGTWLGQDTKWHPLDTKYTIKVTLKFKGKSWTQEKEVSPLELQRLEMVKMTFRRFRRLIESVTMYFKNKLP